MVSAEDGADALLKLGGRQVDLVVSDINMPNLNGVQLMDIMHKHAIEIPVLFVTGYSADEMQARGLALGPDDYIQKRSGKPRCSNSSGGPSSGGPAADNPAEPSRLLGPRQESAGA